MRVYEQSVMPAKAGSFSRSLMGILYSQLRERGLHLERLGYNKLQI